MFSKLFKKEEKKEEVSYEQLEILLQQNQELCEQINLINKVLADVTILLEHNENSTTVDTTANTVEEYQEQEQEHLINSFTMTPSDIVSLLGEHVVGQMDAKKTVAITVCNYLCSLDNHSDLVIDKNNLVLVGNSGCGKTHLIKTLSSILDIPFMCVDSTEFSSTGYKGKEVHSILAELLDMTYGDVATAERSIIFVDEIDKIASKGSGENSQFDKGVQHALLKMIEGEKYNIGGVTIDTSKILFIFSGAFEGLYKAKEDKKNSIGFAIKDVIEDSSNKVKISQEDLIEYGLIKELVGRLGQVIELEPLDDSTLRKILIEPKHSIVNQYDRLFEIQNISDFVSVQDVDDIIEKAKKSKCGARSIKIIAAEHFKERFYR